MKKLLILIAICASSCVSEETQKKLEYIIWDTYDLGKAKPIVVLGTSKRITEHGDIYSAVLTKNGEFYQVNNNDLSCVIFHNYKVGDTIK